MLLQEMESYLKKYDKTLEEVYKPRKSTLEKIRKYTQKNALHLVRNTTLTTLGYEHQLYNESLLLEMTGFNYKNLRILDPEIKKELLGILQESLTIEEIPTNYYSYFFKNKCVPIRERVRLVTKGEDMDRYIIIDKEEEKRVVGHYENLTKKIVEFTLYQDETILPGLFENILAIYGENNTGYSLKDYGFSEWLKEETLSRKIQNDNVRLEVKELFKQKAAQFKDNLLNKQPSVYFFYSYLYLFDQKELEQKKVEFEEHAKRVFGQLKTSRKKDDVKKVKTLYHDLNRVYKLLDNPNQV